MADEYAIPLNLTTPPREGQNVRDAQWLMAGNNRFEGLAPYNDGDIDGIYGPLTAQATRRAKFWLGFPDSGINTTFGQTVYEYLRPQHWRPLPADYQARRAQRIKDAEETLGSKALAAAVKEIGTTESPHGSNRQKYGAWYRMNGVPWCAIFDSWCFDQSGYKRFRYSYVPTVADDAIHGRNRLTVVRSPRPGDLALHTVHGTPNAHISFFEKWISEPAGTFYDVGGNTGPSDVSNGGAVMRQTRYRSNMTHFVRVT